MNTFYWERGNNIIIWDGTEVIVPANVLWAVELTVQNGFAVVTIFDENTPTTASNGYVYIDGAGFKPIVVNENNHLVRFLGCYIENNNLIINAANNTEYVVDPVTVEIISSRYYR